MHEASSAWSTLAWIAILAVAYAGAYAFWRRTAYSAVAAWCCTNGVAFNSQSFAFTMGRPARVSLLGQIDGLNHLFVFSLHSGLRAPLGWKVVLREKTVIKD